MAAMEYTLTVCVTRSLKRRLRLAERNALAARRLFGDEELKSLIIRHNVITSAKLFSRRNAWGRP